MPSRSNKRFSQRRSEILQCLFLAHPDEVGESYFQRQLAAIRIALALFSAGTAATLHDLVPGLCKTTARRRIAELHDQLQARSSQLGH